MKNLLVSNLDDESKKQVNTAQDAQFKYTSFMNKSVCRLNDERQLASKQAGNNSALGQSDVTKSRKSMFSTE